MKRTLPKLIILLSAILYGIIEATHVQFGPATLFHIFIFNYHIPMALLMLIICYGYDQLRMIPVWIVMEDITFFIATNQFDLTRESWVAFGIGGLQLEVGMFIPFTYVILLSVWIFLEWFHGAFDFSNISLIEGS
jgi:hypothetical protein